MAHDVGAGKAIWEYYKKTHLWELRLKTTALLRLGGPLLNGIYLRRCRGYKSFTLFADEGRTMECECGCGEIAPNGSF